MSESICLFTQISKDNNHYFPCCKAYGFSFSSLSDCNNTVFNDPLLLISKQQGVIIIILVQRKQ